MNYKYGILVDSDGYKIDFYNLTINPPQLNESKSIIMDDYRIANSMAKPRWTGNEWVETATSEEIEASKCLIS